MYARSDDHWHWLDGTRLSRDDRRWESGRPRGQMWEGLQMFGRAENYWFDRFVTDQTNFICEVTSA